MSSFVIDRSINQSINQSTDCSSSSLGMVEGVGGHPSDLAGGCDFQILVARKKLFSFVILRVVEE